MPRHPAPRRENSIMSALIMGIMIGFILTVLAVIVKEATQRPVSPTSTPSVNSTSKAPSTPK